MKKRLVPYQKETKCTPAMKIQYSYSYKTFPYIHCPVPVGIMLLRNWVVLRFHWKTCIFVNVGCFFIHGGIPELCGATWQPQKIGGKKQASPVPLTLKLQQSTHHSSSAALSPHFYVCGDPYPSEPHCIFMIAVHSKNLLYRKRSVWKLCKVWTYEQHFTFIKITHTLHQSPKSKDKPPYFQILKRNCLLKSLPLISI